MASFLQASPPTPCAHQSTPSQSFFLSLLARLLLPTHCGCGGRLFHLIIHYNTHINTHTHTHTLGMTHLDRGSPHPRGVYLYNTQHAQQTDITLVGFESAIPACERPHTYALGRAAIGVSLSHSIYQNHI